MKRDPLFAASAAIAALSFCVASAALVSCAKKDNTLTASDIEELSQQIGDMVASVDETGGSSGSYASISELRAAEKFFARHSGSAAPLLALDRAKDAVSRLLMPEAEATSCLLNPDFSLCSGNVIIRNFNGCTIGQASFDGTVTLTWSDANNSDAVCQMTAPGHSITRVPEFTVTGRRGATLSVTKAGAIGQRLTYVNAGSYTFQSDGIRRVFTAPGGDVILDYTTETTSAFQITGAVRGGRAMFNGTARVTHNGNGVTCDFVAGATTWQNSCNCPKSGTWSVNCSDGQTGSLKFTGCGTADVIVGSNASSVTFDRCYGT